MYFKTLTSLQTKYTNGPDKILDSVVQDLDLWIMRLTPRATHFINPLQFASMTNAQWELVLRVFDDATGENMFKPFYLYRDPFTNAIIADGESKKALIEQKTAFNESTLKEVTINPDFIETMFDLQERPIEKLNLRT